VDEKGSETEYAKTGRFALCSSLEGKKGNGAEIGGMGKGHRNLGLLLDNLIFSFSVIVSKFGIIFNCI
jgi:hypothetical protein